MGSKRGSTDALIGSRAMVARRNPRQAKYRLVVYLRDRSGERALLLDFEDLADLRVQVDRFERRRRASGADPFQLHDFRNGAGDTIAFVEKLYQRHDIEEI